MKTNKMKQLLFLVATICMLSSCDSIVNEITEDSKLPIKVSKTLTDTTISYDYNVINTNNNIYIIKQGKINEVLYSIPTENNDPSLLVFGILIGILLCVLIGKILD